MVSKDKLLRCHHKISTLGFWQSPFHLTGIANSSCLVSDCVCGNVLIQPPYTILTTNFTEYDSVTSSSNEKDIRMSVTIFECHNIRIAIRDGHPFWSLDTRDGQLLTFQKSLLLDSGNATSDSGEFRKFEQK